MLNIIIKKNFSTWKSRWFGNFKQS